MQHLRLSALIVSLLSFAMAAEGATNLAREAAVTVDSCYSGYDSSPLNDGCQIVASDAYTRAGWASGETKQPHWVCLSWKRPVKISAVVVYWALDHGAFWTSRRFEAQVRHNGAWRTVAERRCERDTCYALCRFPVSTAEALRISQAPGNGPTSRPNLMWVAEVEAYGTESKKTVEGKPSLLASVKGGTHSVSFTARGGEADGECQIKLDKDEIGRVAVLRRLQTEAKIDIAVAGPGPRQVSITATKGASVSGFRISTVRHDLVEPIVRLKPLHLGALLTPDCVIAQPKGPEGTALSESVQEAVRSAIGVTLPIKTAEVVLRDALLQTHVIAIGSALDNAVCERLYGMRLMYADKVYPGRGGHEVRTVHNPFGAGHNIVVAAGSDARGTQLAVTRLNEHLAKASAGALPRILDLKLGSPQSHHPGPTPEAVKRRVAGYIRHRNSGDSPEWALNSFASYGIYYNKYGDLRWAEAYKALMLALIDWAKDRPPWPMEWLWDPVLAWEVCEEAPCFSDEERLTITNYLLSVARTDRKRYAGSLLGKNPIAHGHQLDQHLCVFMLGDYFRKYYRLPEADEWLRITTERLKSTSLLHRLRHDSADYNGAAFAFIMRYAMHSGDLTYVTTGNLRKFAELELMCHDNLNWRAQFGDGHDPMRGPRGNVLSYASWFYKDGKYNWPVRGTARAATSVYVNDIEPVVPKDHIGIKVFGIEPRYYEFLTGVKPTKGYRPPRSITHIGRCYDKLTLRSGYGGRDQYLMLDGTSRGEHSHFDGNSVVRFSANGRIWLFDLDYIRKAPKWHNSLIVIKDGVTRTQPPLCSLDIKHDDGEFAFVRSTMPDYAGVDWERNIIWRKGRWFVFIDRITAREPGPYRFKLLWRSVGETEIHGRNYCVSQAGKTNALASAAIDRDRDRNNVPDGFRRSLTNLKQEVKSSMRLDQEIFRSTPASLRLDAGPDGYAVAYIMVPIEGGERYRYVTFARTQLEGRAEATNHGYISDAARRRFPGGAGGLRARSAHGSADWQKWETEFVPRKDAAHVELCVRVNCQGGGSGTAWFDDMSLTHIAEDGVETTVFPISTEDSAPSQMHIVNTDGAALMVCTFLQRGHGGKDGYFARYPYAAPHVKTLQQVAGKRLRERETYTYMNLIYCSDEDRPRQATLRWVAPTACVVEEGRERTLVGVKPRGRPRPWPIGRFRLDGEMVAADEHTIHLAERTPTGRSDFFGPPRKLSTASPAEFGERLAELVESTSGRGPIGEHLPGFPTKGLELTRQEELPEAIRCIALGDVNRDGTADVVAGDAAGNLAVFNGKGGTLWQTQCADAINAIVVTDADGDGRTDVLAGGDDEHVRMLDCDGKELWAHRFERYHGRDGKVVALLVGDLPEGGRRIVVGTEAWHYYGLSPTGDQLWRAAHPHAATVASLGDIDGDGDFEVLAGNEYYGWPILNHDGKRVLRQGGGPGLVACAMADLTGDSKQEVLVGLGDSTLRAVRSDGKVLWQTSLGDEPTAILCHDLADDGSPEVIAASESLYLYAFSSSGQRMWLLDAGHVIDALAPLPRGRNAAGSRGGVVHVVSPRGRLIGNFVAGSPVVCIETIGETIAAGCQDGRIIWLR